MGLSPPCSRDRGMGAVTSLGTLLPHRGGGPVPEPGGRAQAAPGDVTERSTLGGLSWDGNVASQDLSPYPMDTGLGRSVPR